MSADCRLGAVIVGLVLCGSGALGADEEETPDIEFLEYLGMWEESDEDWLILDETMADDKEDRIDPAPEGEESMERDNAS